VLGEHLVAVCREVASPRILLGGPRGAGKSTLAREVAGQLGRELITFTEPARGNAGWHGVVAKARAHDAFVLFRDCPGLLQSPSSAFLDALDRMEVPVLFACATGVEVSGRVRRRAHVVVQIEETTETEREETWKAAMREAYAAAPAAPAADVELLLGEISAEFKLTKTQIARAVAMLRQQSPAPPGRVQLRQACERQLHP
jgi:replication-associated recombination protein RarA